MSSKTDALPVTLSEPLHKSSGDPVFDLALQHGGRVAETIEPTKVEEVPTTRPLRVFWNSNAPWGMSGYCNQTREIVPRIRKSGLDIACGNFFGLEGGKLGGYIPFDLKSPEDIEAQFATIPQYPKMADTWGVDQCIHHANDFGADCVITLQDVWPMDPNGLRQINHWIPYVPIDHNPVPKIVTDRLSSAYRIISMSEFGQRELARVGFHSEYIPHMVDTDTMQILDKAECRKMLNIPEDIFLFGIIGANKEMPSRKGFEHALKAFAEFHKKNPKSGIYFHVNMNQPGGLNILEWCDPNHYDILDSIYYIQPYEQAFKVGRDQMTRIINTFDCLLAPSISEGFGIPIIEAQACGVPVITTDWCSMTELVEEGKTGFAVPVREKRPSPLASYFGIPDEEAILKAMEEIYAHPMDRNYIRQRIVDNYDSNLVFEKYWQPFLMKLKSELVV